MPTSKGYLVHIIDVFNDYETNAEMRCDCGTWRQQANNDIEVMAKSITHIHEYHQSKGVIEFPTKYIVIADETITVLEKS